MTKLSTRAAMLASASVLAISLTVLPLDTGPDDGGLGFNEAAAQGKSGQSNGGGNGGGNGRGNGNGGSSGGSGNGNGGGKRRQRQRQRRW